ALLHLIGALQALCFAEYSDLGERRSIAVYRSGCSLPAPADRSASVQGGSMHKSNATTKYLLLAAWLPAVMPATAQETELRGENLLRSLRQGGYVLLMRDPQSEQTLPQARPLDEQEARGGTDLERLVG